MNRTVVGLIASLAICAGFSVGQISSTAAAPPTRPISGSATFEYFPVAGREIEGAPYSGEEVSESLRVLADGTRITQNPTGRKMYRDSAGRTRIERLLFPGPQMIGGSSANSPIVVEIYDPVAGFRYTLDTTNKVAHRLKVQTLSPQQAPFPARDVTGTVVAAGNPSLPVTQPNTRAQPARPTFSSESLGTQVINGVPAEGRRTITTIPIGAQGNDRPMVTTTEVWYSPDLRLVVLSRKSDPRSGESTTQMQGLSRAEPDVLLFTIPGDYSVVDETGQFTIQVNR